MPTKMIVLSFVWIALYSVSASHAELIGRPGCGILQVNGQPTAQNTRETGADGSTWFSQLGQRKASSRSRKPDVRVPVALGDMCDQRPHSEGSWRRPELF
jgi:hypothetical protein